MTYKTIPWPSVPGVGPAYSADDWKGMQRTFGGPGSDHANSGVIWTTGDPLRVRASDPASLTVNVQPGSAFVNGLWVDSDAVVPLTLDAADPTYTRLDLAVLRSDATNQTAAVALKTGTPGPAPTPPALDQSGSPYYEIPLAQIQVGPGVSSIDDGKILDARRFHNAAADHQVIPAKTVGLANRGEAVYWRPAEYPAGANGVEALRVSTTPFDPSYISPLAGVVLETATNDWTLVLTRGLYQMRVADGRLSTPWTWWRPTAVRASSPPGGARTARRCWARRCRGSTRRPGSCGCTSIRQRSTACPAWPGPSGPWAGT